MEYPDGNSDIAAILANLGNCYWRLGFEQPEDLRIAITHHEQALQMRIKFLGNNHPVISYSYNNLAVLCLNLNTSEDLKKAIQYCDMALSIVDPNSDAAATSWNTKGVIYLTLGIHQDIDESIECFKCAINVREKKLSPKHPNCARSKFCLGICYLIQENYIEGIPLIIEALEIFKENLTETNSYVIKALQEFPRLKILLEKNSSPESKRCLQVMRVFECWADPTTCSDEPSSASDSQLGFFRNNTTISNTQDSSVSPTTRM